MSHHKLMGGGNINQMGSDESFLFMDGGGEGGGGSRGGGQVGVSKGRRWRGHVRGPPPITDLPY